MFNKKRIAVFGVFFACMFAFITFASGTPQNQAINTRDVVFIDSYNNETLATRNVIVGEDVQNIPEGPKHSELVFVGWYLNEDRTVRVTDFTNITENMTVIALYGADRNGNGIVDEDDPTYTVSFVDNGTVISTQEILLGMNAVAPNLEARDGYTFAGWSTAYTNVRSNLTVNSVWNSNSPIANNEETGNNGEENVTPVLPGPGEMTDPEPEVRYYTVTFIDGVNNEVIDEVLVEEGLTAGTPIVPVKEGYVFIDWTGDFTNIRSNVTIIANYKEDKNGNGEPDDTEPRYSVKYHKGIATSNGEAPVDKNEYIEGDEYIVLDTNISLNKSVFLGWITDRTTARRKVTDASELENLTIVNPYDTAKIAKEDVTYYGLWAADENENGKPDYTETTYKVTFTAPNHSDLLEDTVITVFEGTKFGSINIPTVKEDNTDGITFSKWYNVNNGHSYGLSLGTLAYSLITEDTVFEAVFVEDLNNNGKDDKEDVKYTLTFKSTRSPELLSGESTITVFEGTTFGSINIPEIIEDNTDFITFAKWVDIDTYDLYSRNLDELKNEYITKNMTFEATYSEDKNNNNIADESNNETKFKVTFRAAEGYEDLLETSEQTILIGQKYGELNIPDVTSNKNAQYVFDKWVDERGISYGSTLGTLAYTGADRDKEFTATFKLNEFTVKFIETLNGTTLKEEKVTYGGRVSAPAGTIVNFDPEYEFVSWDILEFDGYEREGRYFNNITKDLVIRAIYKPVDVEVEEPKEKYEITINIHGEDPIKEEIEEGDSVSLPTPSSFVMGNTRVDFKSWETNDKNITITYDSETGNYIASGVSANTEFTATYEFSVKTMSIPSNILRNSQTNLYNSYLLTEVNANTKFTYTDALGYNMQSGGFNSLYSKYTASEYLTEESLNALKTNNYDLVMITHNTREGFTLIVQKNDEGVMLMDRSERSFQVATNNDITVTNIARYSSGELMETSEVYFDSINWVQAGNFSKKLSDYQSFDVIKVTYEKNGKTLEKDFVNVK